MRRTWSGLALAAIVCGTSATAQTIPEASASAIPDATDRPLPNGNLLVRSMVDRQRYFEKAIDDYTYDMVTTRAQLDGEDRAKESHVRHYQIFFVKGQGVRKLVEEDGRPLPPEKAEKEEARVLKEAEKARNKDRGAKEENESEVRLSEVLARFDFTAVAREVIGGRTAVLVSFRALPGKRKIKQDNVYRALQGRLWIAEEERTIVRAELSNSQKIKIAGGLLASISSFDVAVDFVPVNEIWLPHRSEAFVAGRVLLFKGIRERLTKEFSNYRRFGTSTEEAVAAPGR
jgi:hypothetical protein